MQRDETHWARETFGEAILGDRRRVERLVAMAAKAAAQPTGTVTGVLKSSAEQEGAFRFLENEGVSRSAVQRAAFRSTARLCAGEGRVFVPVDGSSLTLKDFARKRELGRIGGHAATRGLSVMSALAVDQAGKPVGLLDQRWWAREHEPR